MTIHPTAIISKDAELADNVVVGPYSVIGPGVMIERDTVIHSHVVIQGPTKIGRGNEIFQFASIGEVPQDKKFHGEASRLEIGNDNVIREGCTIQRGTEGGGMLTRVGHRNLFMGYAHIAHDCILADDIIMANFATLAGHVTVHAYANIGAFCAIHQFCYVGTQCFIARAAMVSKDVLPFTMVTGPGAKVSGLNSVGMRRRKLTEAAMLAIKNAYKIIYRQGLSIQDAINLLHDSAKDIAEVQLLIDFLQLSQRGIVR